MPSRTLAVALECEINTLCVTPKRGLFGFCVGLVVYNLMGIIKGGVARGCMGRPKVEEMSAYYMADEMGGVYRGMMIAIPEPHWRVFAQMSAQEFACVLGQLGREHQPGAVPQTHSWPQEAHRKEAL